MIKTYQEVVARAGEDETLLYLEPAMARKFFVDRCDATTRGKIGESLIIQRFLVKACWILEYLSLLAALVISLIAFTWYSTIVIPLILIGFFTLEGEASTGKQRITDAVVLTGLCYTLAYFLRNREIMLWIWFLIVPLPFLFIRLTYCLATSFLYSLCVRNGKAFTLLFGDRIIFKEEAAALQPGSAGNRQVTLNDP